MKEILQDLSPTALVEAIESNALEFFSQFARWPRAETHIGADMTWIMTDIPFPLFNSAQGAKLAPEEVDDAIEAMVKRCKSRNVPMLWWIGPGTRPANLGSTLLKHGFTHLEELPGMAIDLLSLPKTSPTPTSLVIEPVSDSESARKWCQTATTGFGMPDFVTEPFLDLVINLGLDSQLPFRNYLGWWLGEPVATSSLFLGAGVAGIYNVATLPSARRHGIGARMTLAPLLEARALGYRVGVLGASEMGLNVYRKMGFREYCKIDQYVWSYPPTMEGRDERW